MTPEEFYNGSLRAASNLMEGNYLCDPVGRFEFMNFLGSPEQAVKLFLSYRKFIVARNPANRLLSAWNYIYNSGEGMLAYRLFHCENSAKEKKSFRFFMDNISNCPNHHFDSIGSFVSFDTIKEGGVEVVSLNNLNSYWNGVQKEYNLPSLEYINKAKIYLDADIEKTEILKDKKIRSYYLNDFKLMKLAL